MVDSPLSLNDAKQQLEKEMTDRQRLWMNIFTGQTEDVAAKKELLESEIEDRKFGIEKLETQSCCDHCGTQVGVPEMFRVRITQYRAKLPLTTLVIEKVHVRAECAACSSSCDSYPELGKIIATKFEIVRAIEMLSCSEQWQDLKKNAYWRAQRFPANLGKTGEDLVQEALVSTLEGRKNWNMAAVDIFGHLLFAMKNIAHGWEEKFYRWESTVEAVTHNAGGVELSLLDNKPSGDPSVYESVSARDEVERLFGKFREDRVATAILQAQLKGVTTAREIMQEQSLTKRQYEAGRRRIRSQKSALIVEEYDQVLELFARSLRAMEFAVVTASSASEGLRLYRECGPFDVVMMSHLNGVELAMNIRQRCPSQNMIITTTHCSEEDVVRPSELAHVPILLKPFSKTTLQAALDGFANSAKENRCRQTRRKVPTFKIRMPLRIDRASKLPKRDGIHSTTPTS
jgi:CheY-like chemotaxis protein